VTTTPELLVVRCEAAGLYEHRDDLLDVYAEVYADRLDDPFFSLPRYWERLDAYAKRKGFSLVIGSIDGKIVGYALGYTLPEGSGWWQGLRGEIDPALLTEDGSRTFALTEIMVRADWRRLGHARRLHDSLLANRSEERATLLVLPDNIPARTAYLSWNWYKLGDLRPFDDAPTYEAMVLDLR
jgi:ribosomal protein S18 acetylase RimI-like enzyme